MKQASADNKQGLTNTRSTEREMDSDLVKQTKAEAETYEKERITYTRWEMVVPCSSLPSHALENATAVQGVPLVTAERYGTASKVTLVTDFETKLGHTWIIAVGQLKAWTEMFKRPIN